MEKKPIHLGAVTISNKPYGIICYRVRKDTTGFIKKRTVTLRALLQTYWYKSQKQQRQALSDLIVAFPNSKFLPFKNDFKTEPFKLIPDAK